MNEIVKILWNYRNYRNYLSQNTFFVIFQGFLNKMLANIHLAIGIHKKYVIFRNINLRAGNGCFRYQILQNCAFWSTDTTAKHQFAWKWCYRFLTVESLLCVQKNKNKLKNLIFWRILTLFENFALVHGSKKHIFVGFPIF